MSGMPALIHERLICLLAGEDAHEHVTLVVLSKMTAHTALSVVNRLHHAPPALVDSSNRDGVVLEAVISHCAHTTKDAAGGSGQEVV